MLFMRLWTINRCFPFYQCSLILLRVEYAYTYYVIRSDYLKIQPLCPQYYHKSECHINHGYAIIFYPLPVIFWAALISFECPPNLEQICKFLGLIQFTFFCNSENLRCSHKVENFIRGYSWAGLRNWTSIHHYSRNSRADRLLPDLDSSDLCRPRTRTVTASFTTRVRHVHSTSWYTVVAPLTASR